MKFDVSTLDGAWSHGFSLLPLKRRLRFTVQDNWRRLSVLLPSAIF